MFFILILPYPLRNSVVIHTSFNGVCYFISLAAKCCFLYVEMFPFERYIPSVVTWKINLVTCMHLLLSEGVVDSGRNEHFI